MPYSDLDDSDSEFESIQLNSAPKVPPVKNWDKFREIPPKIDTGSAAVNPWFKRAEQCLLIIAYMFTLLAVITACVISKGTAFFMISQISNHKKSNLSFCNSDGGSTGEYISNAGDRSFVVDFHCMPLTPDKDQDCDLATGLERSAWLWCIFFAFAAPQVGSFLRSLRFCLFKFQHRPGFLHFLFVCFMEVCHTAGLAMLVFLVLPEMDTFRGMILTTGCATVPSMLLALSRWKKDTEGQSRMSWLWLLLDIPAVLAQISAAILWLVFQSTDSSSTSYHKFPWAIPLSLVLMSCGWWETYIEESRGGPIGKWLWEVKKDMLERSRYFTYLIVSPLKVITFFAVLVLSTIFSGNVTNSKDLKEVFDIFTNDPTRYLDVFFKGFLTSFGNHTYRVVEVIENTLSTGGDLTEGLLTTTFKDIPVSDSMTPVYVLAIHIATSYGAYIFAKFASKVQIQTISFALPITCVIPICLVLIIGGCGMRADDECAFVGTIPNNLFYECPQIGDFLSYSWEDDVWIFLIWFLSYIWITVHIWYPKSPRLASTEQIFGTPWYESLFIDQSLMLNRRRDGDATVTAEELEFELGEKENLDEMYATFPQSEGSKTSSVKNTDKITRIYACATMWHENKEEMMEMLKSLYRIDMDYSARRLAQKYMGVVDQDFYEWETHILFDDCMEVGDNPEEEQVINKFVRLLVETMNEAGSHAYGRKIKVKPCKKYPTPYGGRLVWTLPGKTKIVCHLKDKDKIRHKKRWSQCMYMYYLLGYKLMELPISDDRKDAIAENTYLLALDGDIDFQPEAIIRLVDLMKKNKNVGAACGRIHPTGSGYMPWYQIFEYAVGHWLQKATEHILGCVLCSPGCFSLFRGKALMDDNVMRKYTTVSTEPRHYVQYDQGEDRWLCTLLLQRGWRVEYSAASDAYTACPVTFDEFYNQRRRWMPSTIMNIYDLLSDYKNVVSMNPDISILYIGYQAMLMFSTFIGPGSIFMVLAGSLNTVFGVTYFPDAMLYNMVPVLLFCLACYYMDSKIQLMMAKVFSVAYVLIMLAVFVGIAIQISQDGSWLSPSALGFLSVFLSFVVAAIFHPYEFYCLPFCLIYYMTVPSMYLLLVIYSLFNLWNVSWGTREVAQKKTKAEMEADKKAAEEIQKSVKKEGMMAGLLEQFQLGGKGGDQGGFEFSLANLFKCMCFTHDDPLDPKKQLVSIASSLDRVNQRLSNIESSHDTANFARRSSFGNRRRMTSVMETAEEEEIDTEDMSSEGSMSIPVAVEEKIKRDPEKNPFWLDDFYPDHPELGGGPVDYLPGTEIMFWRELIKKYLEPLEMSKKDKQDQLVGLKGYRDQLVFTFVMANLLWVLGVSMMQTNKDMMSINWPLDPKYNISYNSEAEQGPQIDILTDALILEPIGLFFMVAFIGILTLQIIGMLMHRWTNFCHTIATTKLEWCEKKAEDYTEDGDVDKIALTITRELQAGGEQKEEEKVKLDAIAGRRNTIHNLSQYHRKVQGDGEEINLEKEFRKKYDSTEFKDMMARRLSTRRDTIAALEKRRSSFMNMERRRSTIAMTRASMSSKGFNNSGFDSDFGDDMTDVSGASTYRDSEFGRNSVQFDTFLTSSKM